MQNSGTIRSVRASDSQERPCFSFLEFGVIQKLSFEPELFAKLDRFLTVALGVELVGGKISQGANAVVCVSECGASQCEGLGFGFVQAGEYFNRECFGGGFFTRAGFGLFSELAWFPSRSVAEKREARKDPSGVGIIQMSQIKAQRKRRFGSARGLNQFFATFSEGGVDFESALARIDSKKK